MREKTMSIETIKLMLDALENHTAIKHPQQIHYRDRAIEAGRQAVADFEKQEPVAWRVKNKDVSYGITCYEKEQFDIYISDGWEFVQTLYDHPQPKQKPLTDGEIWKFWWNKPEVPEGEDDSMEAQFVAAVRAVLAAYGIK